MSKIWIFRSVLFAVAAVTIIPFLAFLQFLVFQKAFGLEAGFFVALMANVFETKHIGLLGTLAMIFFVPSAVLIIASVFVFDVLPENGELVITRDSAYFRTMSLFFEKDRLSSSDGCGFFWRTLFLTVFAALLTLISALLLSLIVDLVLRFYANPWLGFRIVGIIVFVMGAVAGLIYGAICVHGVNTGCGRVLKEGFFAVKNRSCPRIRVV